MSNQEIIIDNTVKGACKRGCLHTHTCWSDGRVLPELAVKLYQDCDYDFLCLSDHRVFQDDPENWREIFLEPQPVWPPVLLQEWIDETRKNLGDIIGSIREDADGTRWMRLATYEELKQRFHQDGKFLLLPGSEITNRQTVADGRSYDTHFNLLNLHQGYAEKRGEDVNQTIAISWQLYLEACQRFPGRKTLFTLNHPQWRVWDIQPNDLLKHPQIRHFEVCNGGTQEGAPDWGPQTVDTFWDVALAHRLEDGQSILYATASDDTHYYSQKDFGKIMGMCTGWQVVYCPGEFTNDTLLEAIDQGQSYASCGVFLEKVWVDHDSRTLNVQVQAEADTQYQIDFITTRKGFDRTCTTRPYEHPTDPTLSRDIQFFSPEIGTVVSSVKGPIASCQFQDDYLYLRARVTSNKPTNIQDSVAYPHFQTAWIQPVVL